MSQKHRLPLYLALSTLIISVALIRISWATTTHTTYLPMIMLVPTFTIPGSAPTSESSATAVVPTRTTMVATATATATTATVTTATATTATATTATVTTAIATTATAIATPSICKGVYPIGIDSSVLSGDDFMLQGVAATDGGLLTEGTYAGHTWRRLYFLGDNNATESTYLRWQAEVTPEGIPATSLAALVASLSGPGNYGLGFEEAPWPDAMSEPSGYPSVTGYLSTGDWVFTTVDGNTSSVVTAALDEQIAVMRPMIVPIYSQTYALGSYTRVRVSGVGEFVITGRGQSSDGTNYLEFIYLGKPIGQNICPEAEITGSDSQ